MKLLHETLPEHNEEGLHLIMHRTIGLMGYIVDP